MGRYVRENFGGAWQLFRVSLFTSKRTWSLPSSLPWTAKGILSGKKSNNTFTRESSKQWKLQLWPQGAKELYFRNQSWLLQKRLLLEWKMCSGKCMGLFDETSKSVVEGHLWIKPKAPVWVCQGLVNKSNCCQALCSDCAKVMMSCGLLVWWVEKVKIECKEGPSLIAKSRL